MSGCYTDYLDPLPTTLDAKNSPLALLAQTCYNISKDDSAKALIPPIEKKKDGRDSAKSTSPVSDKALRQDSKSPREKGSPVTREPSRESGSMKFSPKDKYVMRRNDTKRGESPREKSSPSSAYRINTSVGQELKSTTNKGNPLFGNLSVDTNHNDHVISARRSSSLSPPAGDRPPSGSNLLSSSKLAQGLYGHTGLLSPYYPSLGLPMYPGYPHLANPTAAASLLEAAGASERHKAETSSKHTTVTHATVKTISGATTLVPVCSDPVCGQCRVSVQAAQYTPSCPPGCTDCPRDGGHKAPMSSLAPHPALAALHPLARLHPALYGSTGQADLRNGQNSPPTGSTTNQHICSWVANGKYCGERFSTSEELMSHLRSHTSSLDHPPPPGGLTSSSLPSAYSSLAHHPSLALSHLYGLSATPLSSLSAAAPIRNSPYGRSLSPTSVLSSSRFHPYIKSPLSHIPASMPSGYPSAPPSLGAFPGLYSFPGSRLGPLVP